MQNNCNCNCNQMDDPRFVELKEYIDALEGIEGSSMPILQEAQRIFGYLPLEVQKFISEHTKTPIAELYGIATFYSQFNITPQGKNHVAVCLGTACYVKGAQKVIDKVSEVLNVEIGGTTQDRLFTLEGARCLGCCGLAPVMMINEDVYANLDNVDVIPEILDKYRG